MILSAMILPALVLFFAGCSDKNGGEGDSSSRAQLVAETVNCFATTNNIVTSGRDGLTFEAEIEAGGEWCSFALTSTGPSVVKTSGDVGRSIYLYLKNNTTDSDRTATVRVAFSDGYSATLSFTQTAYLVSASYDRAWGEQPRYEPSDDYIYKTYYVSMRSGRARNYSICFDRTRHVSNWVAYPVHSSYSSYGGYQAKNTNGRTDAWAYDDTRTEYADNAEGYVSLGREITQPEIAQDEQQYILRAYGAGGLQRGHMLASATRLATWDCNAQTFYATNMMPQNGSLNSGIWANLESSERYWGGSGRYDTLWVVTGASFKRTTTISNNGNRVAVPSHCWKVMLRLRSGVQKQLSECGPDDLKAVGFIFSNDAAGSGQSLRGAACSVSEVETFTGFEFFRNLSADAAAVKQSYSTSDWSGL